jgi:flagellar biosynthesis/type III secretory pathway M-ring protein FliF/YscJ
VSVLLLSAPVLTAGQSTPAPAPAPASGQEFGSASTLGFVVLVLFFIAVAFLARSMAKHLKKIQKPFEEAEQAEADGAEAESDSDSDSTEQVSAPTEQPKADA